MALPVGIGFGKDNWILDFLDGIRRLRYQNRTAGTAGFDAGGSKIRSE